MCKKLPRYCYDGTRLREKFLYEIIENISPTEASLFNNKTLPEFSVNKMTCWLLFFPSIYSYFYQAKHLCLINYFASSNVPVIRTLYEFFFPTWLNMRSLAALCSQLKAFHSGGVQNICRNRWIAFASENSRFATLMVHLLAELTVNLP